MVRYWRDGTRSFGYDYARTGESPHAEFLDSSGEWVLDQGRYSEVVFTGDWSPCSEADALAAANAAAQAATA